MRQFAAFSKKELCESVATFKLWILLAVFLLFGLMSPLIAKFMPELLKSLGDASGMAGLQAMLQEPTALDAWAQFFKNVGQMGMLVLVIMFCGTMAGELSRGTLINLLAKGLSRRTVILSKFAVLSILWSAAYLLCLGVSAAYTAYFWGGTGATELSHPILAFASLWLFGELLLSLLIFGGTLFGNIYGSLLSCLGLVIALNLVGIIPGSAKYNPVSLSGGTLALLSGAAEPKDFIPAIAICAAMAAALVVGAIAVFDRKTV
jgi:ABC-2 type transport system permease protein